MWAAHPVLGCRPYPAAARVPALLSDQRLFPPHHAVDSTSVGWRRLDVYKLLRLSPPPVGGGA